MKYNSIQIGIKNNDGIKSKCYIGHTISNSICDLIYQDTHGFIVFDINKFILYLHPSFWCCNHRVECFMYFERTKKLFIDECDIIINKPNIWSLIPYNAKTPYDRPKQRIKATTSFVQRLHRAVCIETISIPQFISARKQEYTTLLIEKLISDGVIFNYTQIISLEHSFNEILTSRSLSKCYMGILLSYLPKVI